jgi:hypothetical protein
MVTRISLKSEWLTILTSQLMEEYVPTMYDAMMILAPTMQKVWDRHRFRYPFSDFCNEVVYYKPEYNTKLFDGLKTWELVDTIKDVFHFTKTTAYDIRVEFLQWLKKYWDEFAAETCEEVFRRMRIKLGMWNEQHPDQRKPKINWVPEYGGVVQAQTSALYHQLVYMETAGQNYALTGEQVHAKI